jgi:hypothetical protein
MSDYKRASRVLDALPATHELLADRGYDSDWFREALINKGISQCISLQKVCEAANRLRISKIVKSNTNTTKSSTKNVTK